MNRKIQLFLLSSIKKIYNYFAASISITYPWPETTIKESEIKKWTIWTCIISSFDWTYNDKESCLLLKVEVTQLLGGEPVSLDEGDLNIFPKGKNFRCDVHKGVRKHYRFGN